MPVFCSLWPAFPHGNRAIGFERFSGVRLDMSPPITAKGQRMRNPSCLCMARCNLALEQSILRNRGRPKGMPGACCSSSSEAIQSVLDGLPIDPHLSAPVSRTVCAAVKAGEQIQTLARGYQNFDQRWTLSHHLGEGGLGLEKLGEQDGQQGLPLYRWRKERVWQESRGERSCTSFRLRCWYAGRFVHHRVRGAFWQMDDPKGRDAVTDDRPRIPWCRSSRNSREGDPSTNQG
jgi:hypothetical protein